MGTLIHGTREDFEARGAAARRRWALERRERKPLFDLTWDHFRKKRIRARNPGTLAPAMGRFAEAFRTAAASGANLADTMARLGGGSMTPKLERAEERILGVDRALPGDEWTAVQWRDTKGELAEPPSRRETVRWDTILDDRTSPEGQRVAGVDLSDPVIRDMARRAQDLADQTFARELAAKEEVWLESAGLVTIGEPVILDENGRVVAQSLTDQGPAYGVAMSNAWDGGTIRVRLKVSGS